MFYGVGTSHIYIKIRGMTTTVQNVKASRVYLEKFIAQFLSYMSEFRQNKYLKIISLILSLIHFIFLSVLEFQARNPIPILFQTVQSMEGSIIDEAPYRNWSICWLEFA